MTRSPGGTLLLTLAGVVLAIPGLAGCADGDTGSADPGSGRPTSSAAASPTVSGSASATPVETTASPPADDRPFGPLCGRLARVVDTPTSSTADVPLGSYLFRADERLGFVGGLLDYLGELDLRDATLVVPVNRAFALLPIETRSRLGPFRNDRTYKEAFVSRHVIEGRQTPGQLIGEQTTRGGDALPIALSGDDVTIGAQRARVLCGNIEVQGVTLYVVDAVLLY